MTGNNIATASRKRAAANVIGGRSPNPILMNIQVVPQITARINQTTIFIKPAKAGTPNFIFARRS
jgi:hypothetical protein